jgi:hypothetical protein
MPLGSAVVTSVRGAGLMVISNGPEVALTEYRSVTRTVNVDVPGVVGVPEIRPLALPRIRPGGSWPVARDQVRDAVPLETIRVCKYAKPTSPLGKEVVLIDGGGLMISGNVLETEFS